MLNRKFVRVFVGLIALVVLAFAILPSLYLYNSVDGVVNGRIMMARSPIEGTFHFSKKTEYGTIFKKGEVIGKVTNDRVNQSFLHELITEKRTLEGRVVSLEERIATFTSLNASLGDNTAKYQEFSRKQLMSMIQQEKHKLKQETAERDRAKSELDSNQYLKQRQAISARELEKNEATFRGSSERIIQIENRIEELTNSLKAVESGAFLGDGHNDSPYSKQRMDQLVIEISLAKTAMAEAKSRLIGIDAQIAKEKERIAKAETFELIAPFDALVWRLPTSEGASVVIDTELMVLLDCGSIFLDIAVSESQFAYIKPGEKIRYRLIGEHRHYLGAVFALRGSGGALGDQNLAASVSKDPRREFRIWLRAASTDLELTPENFFQLGRRVEAKIPRKWSPLDSLRRFFDVF